MRKTLPSIELEKLFISLNRKKMNSRRNKLAKKKE